MHLKLVLHFRLYSKHKYQTVMEDLKLKHPFYGATVSLAAVV